MASSLRRQQRNDERRHQILSAAREQADAEGWAAVTTRHLADAIGYSQPVLYGHFPGGKAEIIMAVALLGFVELELHCRTALGREVDQPAEAVAVAYLNFGAQHPAVYEAMFQEPIAARFASVDSEPELRAGFEVLAKAIGDDTHGTATEVFWAALHGLWLLERAGRVRPEHRAERIADLASRFSRDGLGSISVWNRCP